MGILNQDELDKFYSSHVNIYVSADTGRLLNGWPLGIEALLQGAVGIVTDPHNMNTAWGLTRDEIKIVPSNSETASEIARFLCTVAANRSLLFRMASLSQAKIHSLLSYDKSQGRVFAAIEEKLRSDRLHQK